MFVRLPSFTYFWPTCSFCGFVSLPTFSLRDKRHTSSFVQWKPSSYYHSSFCQPVKNKNSLNHWDPTELLRCESISIGTDDSIWQLNYSNLMKPGNQRKWLDNDKVVVYIGMFTFVHVLCWLSSPFFFSAKADGATPGETWRNWWRICGPFISTASWSSGGWITGGSKRVKQFLPMWTTFFQFWVSFFCCWSMGVLLIYFYIDYI